MDKLNSESTAQPAAVEIANSSELRFQNLFKGFAKWCLIAAFIGIIVGAVGALFDLAIREATAFRMSHSWIILILPLAGALIAAGYKGLGMSGDKGTNSILMAVRSGQRLSIRMMILIFAGTVLTHLCGGSAGREGAALQLGGSISERIGALLRLDKKDMRIITMTGMSAGFSALFGTPMAAEVFAMEVTNVGVMQYSAFVPCMIASAVGLLVARLLGVQPEIFVIEGLPELNAASIAQAAVLAIACALLSILFCVALHKSSALYSKLLPNIILRGLAGGLIVAAFTFLVGKQDYNGAGMNIIQRVFEGDALPLAFIMKIIFTALTLGAGFKGGEIVPAFFVGATFGGFYGRFIGMSPSFGAAVGMTAVFCGVTNCPITSMFIAVELFGADGLIFFGITAAVSYLLSGYEGLYGEQKILYSKLHPTYIDKKLGS